MSAAERHRNVFSLTNVHAHRLRDAAESFFSYLDLSTREAREIVIESLRRDEMTCPDRVSRERRQILRSLIEATLVDDGVASDLRSRGGML